MVSDSHLSEISANAWTDERRARWARLLDALPGELATQLRERVAEGGAPSVAIGCLRTLEVALSAGFRPVASIGESAFRCATPSGGEVALLFCTSRFLAPGVGEVGDLARLVESLTASLDRWRYTVHVRRPLPPAFGPAALSRAVQLWRLAMDRGEWRGRHAIYEDEGLSVELSVVDKPSADRPGGLLIGAAPLLAAERLALIYQDFSETLAAFEAQAASLSGSELPIIAVWVAESRWGLSRGHILELLYGRADETVAEWDGAQSKYTAWYQDERQGLFGDPGWRRIASVWCVDSQTCAAHDNPWFSRSGTRPDGATQEWSFPGRRFAKVDGVGRAVSMSWREAEGRGAEERGTEVKAAEHVARGGRTP
jgi:hypothetical protein